ncbi:hypothetical protein GCM10009753_60260 [Streptantibioticus ferralitis]
MDSGSNRTPAATATTTTGTLTQNAADHPYRSTSGPPTNGPMDAPAPGRATAAQIPMTSVRSRGSVKMFRINESVDGITSAPPSPSSPRPAISCHELPAVAATTDATPNSPNPARNSALRPYRSPSAPVETSTPPSTSP